MKTQSLLLTLACLLAGIQLQAQQKSASEYEQEIAHLRDQLVHVIKDAHQSLEESDAEVMRLAQRVSSLEKENYNLKTNALDQLGMERSERIRVTSKLEKIESERSRLDSENTLLRQQVSSLEGEIRAGRITMQHKEAKIKEELQSRTKQIEAELGAMRSAQAEVKAESDELRRTAQASTVQVIALEKDRNNLTKELDHLAEGKVEERKALQNALSEANAQIESKKELQMTYRQRIDSLKYELDGMGRVVDVLSHMDKIERERLAKVEKLERQLAEAELSMNAERKMLTQRIRAVEKREMTLNIKQQRYGEIQAREAALKMLEARLRASASLSPSK
ncbi:MAG: hypothetical protein AB8F95_18000 [Bacteroidia bacterium]